MLWLVDRFHSLVELLYIPMQRSQCLICCCWVPLRSRLSALRDGVDGRSGEVGRRRRRGGGRISEWVGAEGGRDHHGYWLLEDWGFLCYLALEEKEFAVKKSRFSVPNWNRGTEYYPVGIKTHIEYPDIFFWKYNCPYHIEMGTYVLIDLCWAGGSVAPAQPTSLRWNWRIFAQTCSTCLKEPHRKDSSCAHPYRAIDRAWEPRIHSPCSLKAITHATGSKIGSSLSQIGRRAQNTTL